MATTTTNFGWTVPSDTDLVKDGAAAIRTALGGVDTSFVDLKGGTTGQVLSKASGTDLDFAWIAQDDTTLALNAQTGTTYTLVAGDAINTLVQLNNASAITLTCPPSVFSIGDQINVYQRGAGQVTFAQGSGVTIRSTGATSTAPKLRAQYSAATVICIGVSEFLVVGDLI
jgi:hypothetical protein